MTKAAKKGVVSKVSKGVPSKVKTATEVLIRGKASARPPKKATPKPAPKPKAAPVQRTQAPTYLLSDKFESEFKGSFGLVQAQAYHTAVTHGWWEQPRSEGELIALMHSELSEALEGVRHGNPQSDKIPGFTSIEEEYADVIIRIMDHAGHAKLRVAEAILAKMKHNDSRPYRHGGKKL